MHCCYCLLTGLDFLTAVSGAASAISNVGPGLGDMIGPDGNYKNIPDISKWILSFGMLLRKIRNICYFSFIFPFFLEEINEWKFIKNNHYQKLLKCILIKNDQNIITWSY